MFWNIYSGDSEISSIFCTNCILNSRNNHSLTKFDKRIRPSCSVDSMAILIVEFLWQILQEGIGQFLIEASITERQKTGILLNNIAEKILNKKNINFEYKLCESQFVFTASFSSKVYISWKKGATYYITIESRVLPRFTN